MVGSTFKNKFSGRNVSIFLLLVTILVLSGCADGISTSILDECVTEPGAPTTVHPNGKVLCINPQYHPDGGFTEVCLKTRIGKPADDWKVNQMMANLFLFAHDEVKPTVTDSNTITWNDFGDGAGMYTDYFFGDNNGCDGSAGPGCTPDAYFAGDDSRRDQFDDGGTADGSCTSEYTVHSNVLKQDFASRGSYGIQGIVINAVNDHLTNNELPLLFFCQENDPLDDNPFNLRRVQDNYEDINIDDNIRGYLFTQEVYVNDTLKYQVFKCTGGRWKDVTDMEDTDGDGVSDILDCAAEDPTVYSDTSIFVGAEDVLPTEICGDGRSNICHPSENPPSFHSWEFIEEKFNDGTFNISEIQNDDCDFNPAACNEACLFEGNECDYLTSEAEGDYPVQGEGFCCGANLGNDVGRTIENSESGQVELCAYVESGNNMMGGSEQIGDPELPNKWQWIEPNINPWGIFSIKKLGDEPFDVISNSDGWNVCNASTVGYPLAAPNFGSYVDDDSGISPQIRANRFICADFKDRYSWVECVGPEGNPNNPGIKLRTAGNGLYTLPVSSGNQVLLGDLSTAGIYYKQDTENTYGADFTEYDFIEVYLTFTNEEIVPPANLNMRVIGYKETFDNVIFFDQPVLGYAVNAPKVDSEHIIHLKIPIGEWINIEGIDFYRTGASHNQVEVKNVVLTGGDAGLICSGQSDDGHISWIETVDYSSGLSTIRGDAACQELYGEEAWLGTYSPNPEVNAMENSCCGNLPNEYYAGTTKLTEEGNIRGCFNSEVIVEDQSAMNVEYEVDYTITEYDTEFEEITFDWDVYTPVSTTNPAYYGEDVVISYDESPKLIDTKHYEVPTSWNEAWSSERTLSTNKPDQVSVYFFLPDLQIKIGPEFTFNTEELKQKGVSPLNFTVQIIAETQQTTTTPSTSQEQKTFSVPCTDSECLFALPGSPGEDGYTINNLHPELYELYFVTGPLPQDEQLIPQNGLTTLPNEEGMLKVKRLSQQVLYTQNDQDDPTFFGCNTANYILNDPNINSIENVGSCESQGEFFCSPQGVSEDNFFSLNSWSNEAITQIGYDVSAATVDDNNTTYPPRDCNSLDNCTASGRTTLSIAPPGKNILSNIDFVLEDGDDVFGWTLRTNSGSQVTNEDSFVELGVFTVPANHNLFSEKIALTPDTDYILTHASDCDVEINVYREVLESENPNDATENYDQDEEFNSGEYQFAIIQTEDSCDFTQPLLRIVDEYNVDDYEFDPTYPQRKGVACCPGGSCWNGYLCVEDMATHTFLTENVGSEEYRCIDGEWNHQQPKMDWNNEFVGFCETDSQCFVASSIEGADSEKTFADFYNGDYPTCINDGEFILDHQCEAGEWTSRTKNIVTNLIEVVGNDDFVLLCSNFDETLINYDEGGYDLVSQLAGEEPVTSTSILVPTSVDNSNTICFPNIVDPVGERLVPQEQNTCINSVCILKHNDGESKTVATSMNLALDNPENFLQTLGLTVQDLQSCGSTSEFTQCNDNVWYSETFGSIVYNKDGVSLDGPSVVSSVVDWIINVFSTSSSTEFEQFLNDAQNFNKLFLLKNSGQNVRAIQEPSGGINTIVAEFEGFDSPVCEFIFNVNEENLLVHNPPLAPEYLVECTNSGNVYEVMTQVNSDFWWPQLTGSLRASE